MFFHTVHKMNCNYPSTNAQTPVTETLGVNKKMFNYVPSKPDGHVNFNLRQFMWKNSHFYPQKLFSFMLKPAIINKMSFLGGEILSQNFLCGWIHFWDVK